MRSPTSSTRLRHPAFSGFPNQASAISSAAENYPATMPEADGFYPRCPSSNVLSESRAYA